MTNNTDNTDNTDNTVNTLYDPFDKFTFDAGKCFLTGAPLLGREEPASPAAGRDGQVSVLSNWLLEAFSLNDKAIQMLDERITTYDMLKMPASANVIDAYKQIDDQVYAAFTKGYEGMKALDNQVLFHWIGKLVYGMIFNEIQAGIRQQALLGEPLNFSQVLMHKFRNLHIMLQSLVVPMEFEGRLPYSIYIYKVNNPTNHFSYRDEINTLAFSMRMSDFGIIACLQDNGTNAIHLDEDVALVEGQTLHPLQFEELCAKFFYSAYLFNRLPEYSIMPTPAKVYIEPMSLMAGQSKPLFDAWQAKTYGQVLENFWRPWGFTLFEIIQNPDQPMSFLRAEDGGFQHFSPEMVVELPLEGRSPREDA